MLRAGGVGPGKFIEPGLLGCIVLVELHILGGIGSFVCRLLKPAKDMKGWVAEG